MPFTILDCEVVRRVTESLADSIRSQSQFSRDLAEPEIARRFNVMLQQADAILSELDARLKNRS